MAIGGLVLLIAYCSLRPSKPQLAPPSDLQSTESQAAQPQPDMSGASNQQTTPARLTFHGYDCSDDCSGHQAGYDWAEEHDITDPDDCGGNSDSFIEGCKAYAGEDGPEDSDDDDDN